MTVQRPWVTVGDVVQRWGHPDYRYRVLAIYRTKTDSVYLWVAGVDSFVPLTLSLREVEKVEEPGRQGGSM